ncbi:preprotein translocase subunit SecA [Candidatus Peregrinibacteria bacterium]|nr:preprotein translocase subunit SecA [Candidatus Peregrinibacteria bacterium]
MLKKIINRFLGDANEKELRKKAPIVDAINKKEEEFQSLSEEELKSKTPEFIERLTKGESTDDIMVEAFAVVKNACRRLMGTKFQLGKDEKEWDMIPYDVQLIGGIMLHEGKIAEMRTGEGKTLVASLALYLNALAKKGAHLVTVNDYLAKRDAEWMGVIYKYLGLSVGVIVHGLSPEERQEAYGADVTYGTNNEFGFDYLRDNMATKLENRVQRSLHYAIVDEVDSILIDESRTPLIISAPAEESTDKYYQYSRLVTQLIPDEHYNVDEKGRNVTLTEPGIAKMEQLLGVENIYTEAGFTEVHHIEQALKSKALFMRDRDYIVKDDEIIIVDEFTGRLMPGRCYSDGLHQAIEAKENVEVKRESKTLATVTFQNFFRLYAKLAGMTGTAKTEEEEFFKIYGLETMVIPTNKPIARTDHPDLIYKNARGKWNNVVKAIKELNEKGQPVLVGTVSVETSEMLSKMLRLSGVKHEVLNAKHHEREAEIVALAGKKSAVTIATNMAGRGTDIKLGEGVKDLGGLAIIGTERHDSRRIDNQLRGRSGRQGDPGYSRFYISMDDDLMRLFGSDRIKGMMERLGIDDDTPIENSLITRSIESAQKRVEGHNFDIRKHLLEYDDVMNKHREIIYARRLKVLSAEDISAEIKKMMADEAHHLVTLHTSSPNRSDWDLDGMVKSLNALMPHKQKKLDTADFDKIEDTETLMENLSNILLGEYQLKEEALPDPKILRNVERQIALRVVDTLWMEHIDQMTHLRESVSLRGYGQRDPLMEYKQDAYQLFTQLLGSIQHNIVNTLFKLQIKTEAPPPPQAEPLENLQTNADAIEGNITSTRMHQGSSPAAGSAAQNAVVRRISANAPQALSSKYANVGRNDPCPCGSGKKYKKCHGAGI